MVAPKKDDRPEGSDRGEPLHGSASSGSRIAGELTERLRDALGGDSDGDLLLGGSDVEDGIAQWLRALDLQALGACRADERLKPLLKLNISSGLAEDRLISQLSQHFDASEVGILARCLCVPLVSIRVGKVDRQGNVLSPTAIRGHLNLSLLPSSSMHISFIGDDGCTERLGILNNNSERSELSIDKISADISGRSFLLKLPGSRVLYFWSSERSTDSGMQLLAKMKDLLRRKPSLSNITGICESRLDSFAMHLRAYLLGSSNTVEADTLAFSGESLTSLHVSDIGFHSSFMTSKSSRCRFTASNTTKGQPSHQVCLSPRPNAFKEGTARSSSSIRNGIKDKLRRRGECSHSRISTVTQQSTAIPTSCMQSISHSEEYSLRGWDICGLLPSTPEPAMPFLSCLSSSIPILPNLPSLPISASASLFSPYYCWCPPRPSSLQYSGSLLPITFDEPMPLPPLSTLLSVTVGPPAPSILTSSLPLDIHKLPTLSLPSFLPEPFVRLPIPVTTLVSLPIAQEISTLPPYMADPIVHTPVLDICSSGQAYLVSAGPPMSSAIPPLLSSFVGSRSLIANTESPLEKSARETLRMLVASHPVSSCERPVIALPLRKYGALDAVDGNTQGSGSGAVAAIADGGGLRKDIEAITTAFYSLGLSLPISGIHDCGKGDNLQRNESDQSEDSSKN